MSHAKSEFDLQSFLNMVISFLQSILDKIETGEIIIRKLPRSIGGIKQSLPVFSFSFIILFQLKINGPRLLWASETGG